MIPRVIYVPECQCQSTDLQGVGVYFLMTRRILSTDSRLLYILKNVEASIGDCLRSAIRAKDEKTLKDDLMHHPCPTVFLLKRIHTRKRKEKPVFYHLKVSLWIKQKLIVSIHISQFLSL